MLKVLVLAVQNNVADARMEYLIRDRLSWLHYLGFDLGAPPPLMPIQSACSARS